MRRIHVLSSCALIFFTVTHSLFAELRITDRVAITNPAPSYKDYFGMSVARLAGDRFVVGMPQEVSLSSNNWGEAHLFDSGGTLLKTITNPTPTKAEQFGCAVAALGPNLLMVGAYGHSFYSSNQYGRVYLFDADGVLLSAVTNPAPANGTQFGHAIATVGPGAFAVGGGLDAKCVYLYAGSGALLTTVTNPSPDANSAFGYSLAALGADRIVVGAPRDDTGATNAGSVYVFDGNGSLLLTITNPTPAADDCFGWAVAGIGADRLAVGAISDDTCTSNGGSVYLYDLNGVLLVTITNPAGAEYDWFGNAIAEIGERRLLIGAESGGYQNTGAAWIYGLDGQKLTGLTNTTFAWDENFGHAVCGLGDNTFVVNAPYYQSGGAGDYHKQGCAYVYTFRDGNAYFVNDNSTNGDVWCSAVGNDANAGTNPSAPKATVQAVLDTYDLEPRDTVYIDTGYYLQTTNIHITADDAGSAAAYVTLQGSVNGTVINRNTNSWALGPAGAAIYINGADYVRLADLNLTNAYDGVRMNEADGCVLNNLEIRGMSGHGTRLERANGNTMDGITILGCGYRGMDFYQSSNNIVRRGAISGVNGFGIYLSYSASNRFDRCTVAGNDNWTQIISFGQYFSLSNSIVVASGAGNCCLYNYGGPYDGDYNNFYAHGGAYAFDLYTQTSLRDWQAAHNADAHSLCHDPLFADPATGDFHLKSVTGRYTNGAWAADAAHSPCIDVADPSAAWSAEPSPNGSRMNLGCFGNTAQASKSHTNAWLLALSDNNGGRVSGTIDLRWAFGNFAGGEIVNVQYSPDAGATWTNLTTNVTAGACAFAWDTSASPQSQLALWRVVLASNAAVADTVDRTFMVKTGALDFYVNDGATAGDVYCTATGSDSKSGLSPADPKASIQAVILAYHPDPGDTIYVDTGHYLQTTNIEFTSLDEGSASGYVTVRGSVNGTVIERDATGADRCGIYINNAEYIKLHDLIFSNGQAGIVMRYGADHCIVSNVVVRGADTGLDIGWSSYSEFSQLDIRNCGDGLSLSGGNYDTFRHCTIAWNSGDGAHLSRFSEGAWSYGTIRNCTIAYNGYKQIDITGYYQLDLRDSIVVASGSGNACIYQFWQKWLGGHGSQWASDGECRGDYNLLYAENGAAIGGRSDEGGTGHVYAALADWQAYSGQETNSLSAEPKFVEGQDLHLRSSAASGTWVAALGGWTNFPGDNSPGIDAGCPTNSCALEPQWNGGIVNAGAYGNTPYASRSADTDGDWLSDSIEQYRHGTDPNNADSDGDGMGDRFEVLAGTDATNSASVFEADGVSPATDAGNCFVLQWPSATGRSYRIECSTNIFSRFTNLTVNIPATPPINCHTVVVVGVEHELFRVGLE